MLTYLQIEGSTLKTEVLKFAAKTAAALPFWELWAWPMAKNFIAGPDLQKAKKRALRLSQKGYPLIFNYAGEHASDFKTAQTAYNANIELIEWLKKRKIRASISLKFSAFGLTPTDILKNLKSDQIELFIDILNRTLDAGIRTWMDAEHIDARRHYNFVLPILWRKRFENLGRVIQANAEDENWEGFIKDCARVPIPTRICKGAYRNDPGTISFETEYPKIILQYRYAARTLISHYVETEIATSDDVIIGSGHLPPFAHFAMLLGINVQKAKELKEIGEPPHIYFIFGPNWAGYLKRRVLENPEYLLLPFKSAQSGIEAY